MKNLFTFVLLIFSTLTFGQKTFNYKNDFASILAKTKDKQNNLSYEKLLVRFRNNDTTLTDYEILALLIGFTDKPDYKPYNDLATEREIYNLNGDKKYKEGLELANSFLKTHPLSVKSLIEKSYSYHKLSNKDSAEYYLYQAHRVFEAMYFSGNGQSPETPIFALGPADGQDYISKFGDADIGTMGSGRDKDGNFLDILEAKLEDGTSVNLYFIIQHATAKMFDGKSIEEELKQKEKKEKGKKKE